MSSSSGTLNRNNIKELLASIGTVAAEQSDIECTEYNWKACHFFNNDQLEILRGFSASLADVFSRDFTDACQSDYEVSIESFDQLNAQEVNTDLSQQDSKYWFLALALKSAAEPCAQLVLPDKTAHLWARAVLGDTDTEIEQGQELLALEESMLCDFCKRLASSVKQVFTDITLIPADALVSGVSPVNWDSAESLLKISFTVKQSEAEDASEAFLFMPCACYGSVLGDDFEVAQKSVEQDNTSEAIKNAVNNLTVPMSAQLGTISLALEDVMSLKKDDILVMDNSVNHPVDIDLSGKNVFQGIPGKHNGKLAVLITESYKQAY